MAEIGREFEDYNVLVLSDIPGVTVKREAEIKREYGAHCSGVDILCETPEQVVYVQCKWEAKSPSIRDINHFIQGVNSIHTTNTKPFRAFFVSKYPLTSAGIAAFTASPEFESVHANKKEDRATTISQLLERTALFMNIRMDCKTVVTAKLKDLVEVKSAEEIEFERSLEQLKSTLGQFHTLCHNLIGCMNGNMEGVHQIKMLEEYIKSYDIKGIYDLTRTFLDYKYSGMFCSPGMLYGVFQMVKQLHMQSQEIRAKFPKQALCKQFKKFAFREVEMYECLRSETFAHQGVIGMHNSWLSETEYNKIKCYDDISKYKEISRKKHDSAAAEWTERSKSVATSGRYEYYTTDKRFHFSGRS